MNCPYCDETVHTMSKFCPKCGLPLKDDQTVMGAYASDDTGPSIYVIGGGLAGLLIIALLIGWLSSHNGDKPVEQVQRQNLTNPALLSPVNPGVVPGSMPANPAFGFGGGGSTRSVDYSPQVKWAYTPPANPAPAPRPVYVPEVRGPEAPPINLAQEAATQPKAPPKVQIARATTPEIPAGPAVPPPAWLMPGQVMPEAPAIELPEGSDGLPRLTPEARQLERDGVITYDPVQERYVLVPGVKRRTTTPPKIRYVAPHIPSSADSGPNPNRVTSGGE